MKKPKAKTARRRCWAYLVSGDLNITLDRRRAREWNKMFREHGGKPVDVGWVELPAKLLSQLLINRRHMLKRGAL